MKYSSFFSVMKGILLLFLFLLCLFAPTPKEAHAMEIRDAIYWTIAADIGEGQMCDWFTDAILYASSVYQVDPILVTAVMQTESHFQLDVVSSAGAYGPMQETAEGVGVDRTNPLENILGGVLYLSYQLQRFMNWGSYAVTYAVAAYNAGPQAVIDYNGVPPYRETQNYVVLVAERYQNILSLCYS